MNIQAALDEVGRLEDEVTRAAPGDPRLDDVIARTGELAHELEVVRGMAQPLVPDAESPPSHDARSAELLEGALGNIRKAAEAKR